MKYNKSEIMKSAWNIRREIESHNIYKIDMATALQAAWAIAKAKTNSEMEEIKSITMKGSNKQIAWATDIVTRPYNRMVRYASQDEQQYNAERAMVRRASAILYTKKCREAADNIANASWVIDKRNHFGPVMKNCVMLCCVGSSLHLCDFERYFD